MTTRDIREILAGYDINSVGLEYKNDSITEEFKLVLPTGAPYLFTLSHKGTAVSMANALYSHIGSPTISLPSEESETVLMQISDASNASFADF